MICKDRFGRVVNCPPISVIDGGVDINRPYVADDEVVQISERDSCSFNLPNFPISTKRDVARAVQHVVRNNSKACVGPAFEKMCSMIPATLRKNLPRMYRSSCNANTGTSNALLGLSGLSSLGGSYSTREQIVAAVQRCKKSGTWENFNKCAVDLIANTTPEAAKFLPTPFRQMYAAEQRAGMGDAVQTSNEVAQIFNQWVSSLSNAAGQITQNYVQIRAATGKVPPPQPIVMPDSFGGGNTLLYVGGAAALVLVLMMAKR